LAVHGYGGKLPVPETDTFMLFAISDWRSHRIVGLAAATILACTGSVFAAGATAPATGDSPAPSDAEKFCANIVDAASDARFAWEAKTLKDLRAEIETATADLEKKRAELQESLTQYQEFQKLAEQGVVDIYAKMRPEAAAAQLAALDERTAAAVLIKLNARAASAILAEMDTPRAVSLTGLISTGGEAHSKNVAQQ
jgi:flagellar motility protein MotE (MotC chaperone)